MKLEGVRDGELIATRGRTVYRGPSPASLRRVGRLPVPAGGVAGAGFRLRTSATLRRPLSRLVGRFPAATVAAVDAGALVATAGRWVFASADGGATWRRTARLPASSGPVGVLPSALCVHEGTVHLGEYPLSAGDTARIRVSHDAGETWETALALPEVRHVHGVARDPYTGEYWVTTGDADDECVIGRLRDGRLDPVGGGSQEWRAVQPAFTPEYVLWGVDCNYTDEKRIYRLAREDIADVGPGADGDLDPTPVASLSTPVFYSAAVEAGGERWVAFSTSASATPDSTAPGTRVTGGDGTRVVAASSASAYTRWFEVTAARRRRGLVERLGVDGVVPASNAYTFLASDGRRLLVNPYNTRERDGRVLEFGPDFFESLPGRSSATVGK